MTILSESTRNLSGIVVLLICFSVGSLFMSIAGMFLDYQLLSVMGTTLFVILAVYAAIYYRENPQTEYKALIDDTYTVKELYESYEIVGREGEMYILKAKGDKDE